MKEWRRTLRSWPKETPSSVDPASLPVTLRDRARLREAKRGETISSLLAIAVGSLLPMGFAFAGTAWLVTSGSETFAVMTLFSGTVLGLAGLFPASKIAEEAQAKRRRRRTLDLLESHGEATLGGEFVGVAFGDRLWHYPGTGLDADEGTLMLDFDSLRCTGRVVRFEIPKTMILSMEIRCFDAAMTGPEPRLYVAYVSEGRTSAFSVAMPYRRSARRRVQEIIDLRERLGTWRLERFACVSERSFVAPPTGDYMVASRSQSRRISLVAKLLAGLATIVSLIAVETLATFVAIRMGWRRTGTLLSCLASTSYLPWLLFSIKIEPFLPERWRYQEPQGVREAPSLGEAPVSDGAERLAVGQRSEL